MQQREGARSHRDVAKAFGDDDGQADALRARDRNTKVVAENIAQIRVINTARDNARNARVLRSFHGSRSHTRAANHNRALHVSTDLRSVKPRVVRCSCNAKHADSFTADAKDPLHKHRVRFNHCAFARQHFSDHAVDVRRRLHRYRRAAHHHLPSRRAHAFDRASGGRSKFFLSNAKDAFGARDDLPNRNRIAHFHQQQLRHIFSRNREQSRNPNWRDVALDRCARHDVPRLHKLTQRHQHIAMHRQHAPRPIDSARRNLKSGCVSLRHEAET